MSPSNSGRARKRLTLFAGGSLGAISILALAPTAALAANECGPAAGAQTCTGTFASITYPSTTGALTLTLANGVAVTTGGISVTGTGADTVTLNRSDAAAGTGDPSIASAAGIGLGVTTGTGAISVLLTDGDTGDALLAISGATRGVRLETNSTTTAPLTFTFTNGAVTATGPTGIGVEAVSNGAGAGVVALNLGGAVSGAVGVKAISSGTGSLNVNMTSLSATVLGGDLVGTNGAAIQLTPNAASLVTVGVGRTVRAANPGGGVIEFTNVNATRGVIVSNQGGVIRSNDDTISGYDDLVVLVAGGAGNGTVNNTGDTALLQGRVSLLNTGNATVSNGGIGDLTTTYWHTVGLNTLGEGTGVGRITNNRSGEIATNADGAATTFAFGGGADTFNNAGGVLKVGEGQEAAATLTITGLETFTNSGRILFGESEQVEGEVSDGVSNDRITLSGAGTLFTGTNSGTGTNFRTSTMIMDASLEASQADCSAAVVADCLDLRGGSTAGTTNVLLNVVGVSGGAQRVVLVDVAAGTSAAGHFVLDPNTPGLLDLGDGGGVLDGGLFLYGLSYDATAKQHVLAPATLDSEGLELGLVGRAANVAWQTSTGSWLTRQADLRDTVAGRESGSAPGAWLKIAGNFVEDTVIQTYKFGPDMLNFDNGYSQRTTALVGGVDLVNFASDHSAWVIGLTGSRLQSDMEFNESLTQLQLEGGSFGAYASLMADNFFVDGIVNSVKLDAEYSAPSAEIFGIEGDVKSVGYQIEGGWRFSSNDGSARLEPLATLAYVKSDLSDLDFANVGVEFGEVTNFRGALGLRYAGDLAMDALTAQFSVTGRVWQEFEGENAATITIPGSRFALMDDTADALGDVAVAFSLFAGERFSANVGYGVRFKEEYLSTDASLSFRYQW